jgi:uncharacterized membrane protein YgdD (TMEM256/DUF423 family)
MQRLWIALGALTGLGTVGLAAIAAHALSGLAPAAVAMVHSGIEMQGWHALALLAVGLWVPHGGWLADAAGAAFTIGLLMFCGALYTLGLSGISLGTIAPAGGVLLMFGWLLLGISALRAR